MAKKSASQDEYKLKGRLGAGLYWSVAAEIIFAAVVVLCFIFAKDFRVIVLTGFAIFTAIFIILITVIRRGMTNDMLKFAARYSQVQHKLLKELNIPYAILDQKGRVLWLNRAMRHIAHVDEDYSKNIAAIFKEATPNVFPAPNENTQFQIEHNDRTYRAEIENVSKIGNSFITFYLYDITDITKIEKSLKQNSFAVALIDIDNYEDALESIDDISQSFFAGVLEKKIYDYFSQGGSFVRKLEKDRFLAVFRCMELESFTENRFNILEDVKTVNLGNDMTVTLSIGISTGEESYAKCYDAAKSCLELALGRGGDQAVVRNFEKVSYYGGRSQQTETNTRVKVRVKAHALRRIIETKERILIMGHKLPDLDSFGACVGLYTFARQLGKEAYIVINEISSGVRPFFERFMGREEYEHKTFINSSEAIELADASSTVVVVDVNKAELTDCPEILELAGTKVVFDHHRTSGEPIKGVTLSYVDTLASSVCEMVTEMIQLGSTDIKLNGFEADTIYGGIVVDTDNFNTKAGPRTFEAAAYLRRNGADATRVRKLLRTHMEEYKSIAQALSSMEIYEKDYAFAIYYCDGSESPTICAAKTANAMLNIAEVKAAFSVTEYEGKAYISARSIDEVNVQLIMERMGGGGHLGTAGAQIENVTATQAIDMIKETINEMLKEGAI